MRLRRTHAAGLALALIGVLGATCGGPRLVAGGLTITNVSITGPATIAAGGGAAFTVTYDAKVESSFTASVNIVVKDRDVLPEVNPFGDETLLTQAANLPATPGAGQPPAEVTGIVNTITLTCGGTLVGQTVQGPLGDSGEGGSNVFGSDPADIYVTVNNQMSNVLAVSCGS